MRLILALALVSTAGSATAETRSVTADIWADNWFEMYVNGAMVIQDSVPITTERSFNSETVTFTADWPMQIAIMARDFVENDTGLEYIGTNRQQMGDGGLIAQFRDAVTGEIVAVTNEDARCLVVHRAPLSTACAEESNPVAGQGNCTFEETDIPIDWTSADFDDSAWLAATEHAAGAVDPKGGYDQIRWDSAAQLIWSDDLVQDNTLLCRLTVGE